MGFIAATNHPLAAMRKDGRFREDFYYRLCSDVIEVPPLKQRLDENPGEIRLILEFTIKRILGRSSDDLVDKVSSYILKNQPPNYSWSGNIRELEQCTRQILLRQSYNWQDDDEKKHILDLLTDQAPLTAQQLLSQYCIRLYNTYGTYEAVAKITDLDRRTVKKHIVQLKQDQSGW